MKKTSDIKNKLVDIIDRFQEDFKNHGIKCKYKFVNVSANKRITTCLVLRFEQINVTTKNNTKEYSLIVAKNKKGKINQRVTEALNRILSSNLKYAKKKSTPRKNCIFDYFKYIFCYKYSYKKELFGIDINIIRFGIVAVTVLIIALLAFQIRHSYYFEHGHYPLW